jgi:hypothetical protein
MALAGGDLAAASDTLLYGTTGLALIEIDLATQTRTLIGAHGDGLEGRLLYGLELDGAGNLIGLTGDEGDIARLYRIDRATGAASLIGEIPDSVLLGGYGLAYAVPGPGAGLAGLVVLLGATQGFPNRRGEDPHKIP